MDREELHRDMCGVVFLNLLYPDADLHTPVIHGAIIQTLTEHNALQVISCLSVEHQSGHMLLTSKPRPKVAPSVGTIVNAIELTHATPRQV